MMNDNKQSWKQYVALEERQSYVDSTEINMQIQKSIFRKYTPV